MWFWTSCLVLFALEDLPGLWKVGNDLASKNRQSTQKGFWFSRLVFFVRSAISFGFRCFLEKYHLKLIAFGFYTILLNGEPRESTFHQRGCTKQLVSQNRFRRFVVPFGYWTENVTLCIWCCPFYQIQWGRSTAYQISHKFLVKSLVCGLICKKVVWSPCTVMRKSIAACNAQLPTFLPHIRGCQFLIKGWEEVNYWLG